MTIIMDFFLKYSFISPPTLKMFDNQFGSINRKNIEYLKFKEGFFYGLSDQDGNFSSDQRFLNSSNDSCFSILLVGDSYVEGLDVSVENHFSNILKTSLSRKINRSVNVINFGRGNSTIFSSSYFYFNYILKKYRPDLVLYFTEQRDITHNPMTYYPVPFYKYDTIGKVLIVDSSWIKTPSYLFHKYCMKSLFFKNYEESGFFRLAYRSFMLAFKTADFFQLTFGKFYPKKYKGQEYRMINSKNTVSILSDSLYNKIRFSNRGKIIFVLRDFPVKSESLKNYLEIGSFKFINLNDTLLGSRLIKNTDKDAYYFKASRSYGGHWNSEGHKAVGALLADRIFTDWVNKKKYE